MELRHCFRHDSLLICHPSNEVDIPTRKGDEFTYWLLKSNNPKVGPYPHLEAPPNGHRRKSEEHFNDMLAQVEKESLQEILDILLREPLADYFWYGYPEHGGKLSYSLPHHDVVPSNALRVDKEKIKIFLRDYKLQSLLSEQEL